MKHLMIAITLLSGILWAQSGSTPTISTAPSPSPSNGPSYSQMYCSGFVTRQSISRSNLVLGSKESPHEDRFSGRSQLFLGGPALVAGQRYSLLRQVDDPNREDSSPEQRKKLSKLGSLYQEVGWVTVQSVAKGTAIASFDFSCDPAIPGDLVVPFREKPVFTFRPTNGAISPFREGFNHVKGQIVGSKDFVGLLGDGQIVYTDFGSQKGAKAGDYLLVLRGYSPGDLNKIDRASERLPKGAEATAVKPARIKSDTDARLPKRVLGEMLILSLTPQSSTAVITRAFSEIGLGDVVEDEEAQFASETTNVTGHNSSSCRTGSRFHRLLWHLHACRDQKAGS